MGEVQRVNPKSRKFEIGVRNLRDITIWPLSLADEFSFSETILVLAEGFDDATRIPLPELEEGVLAEEVVDNVELRMATYIIKAIKDNLIDLLGFVTDEEITLKDIDNEQFIDLCDVIFEMNFGGAMGKGKRLLLKIKKMFPQKTLSENLSSPPATDTNTSSDSPIETEE